MKLRTGLWMVLASLLVGCGAPAGSVRMQEPGVSQSAGQRGAREVPESPNPAPSSDLPPTQDPPPADGQTDETPPPPPEEDRVLPPPEPQEGGPTDPPVDGDATRPPV